MDLAPLVEPPVLEPCRATGVRDRRRLGRGPLAIVGVDEARVRAAQELLGAVVEGPFERRVDGLETPVEADGADHVRREIEVAGGIGLGTTQPDREAPGEGDEERGREQDDEEEGAHADIYRR